MRKSILAIVGISFFMLFSCKQNKQEDIHARIFQPNWKSLEQYEVPKWFRDSKFGIWAHWGPQCQPEKGDWYARYMYIEGDRRYNSHLENFGHPSEFGFKDVINDWKAEHWDPEKLVALYKRAGAKYFFAMGNHHDNLDLWESKYHEWNSVNVGPHKNILDGWAKAAKNNELPFGVSIHSSHAWFWYETSRLADKQGVYAGVPYDGHLTKNDGKGKWWDGLDPQELYVQNHPLSIGAENPNSIFNQWNWDNGVTPPSEEYCLDFYNRTMDMIDQYNPDLLYFDDTALPFWPLNNVGLKLASNYYNNNMKMNDGKLEAVLFGKVLTNDQKKCMVWDVERGAPDDIQENPWQTCTCIGDWHYDRDFYEQNRYKSSKTVIQMLVDVVSKNGNLLLNVPIRGDGSIDEKELKIVEGIRDWMDINSECIYETRPWIIYGEGPKAEQINPIKDQGFNEGKGERYTSKDIRFTKKGNILYAVVMEWPENEEKVVINSLSTQSPNYNKDLDEVEMLGGKIKSYKFDNTGLTIEFPTNIDLVAPLVFKIY